MTNKFVYSCSIKTHALRFEDLLESIFCLLLNVEAFSPQKVAEMLEEVVVGWQEVRWIWWMRLNFVAQFVQLLKCWLCHTWWGVVVENWARSVTDAGCRWLQFPVRPIDLLSIHLDVMVFPGLRKLQWLDRQQGTKQWSWPCLGASLALGSVWSFLVQSLSWSLGCHIKHIFHLTTTQWRNGSLFCIIRKRGTPKWFFFICG